MRDKLWFYGAYNHFKIDKQVSGVAQNIATDLGVFDNYTGKMTGKLGQNNTFIGYYQQGRKQKPKRGLSDAAPARIRARAGQLLADVQGRVPARAQRPRVLQRQRRQLLARLADGRAGGSGHQPAEACSATTGAVAGAGWIAFSTYRKKPQVKAQMTYYLPEKAGSHDFKFGFETINDSYRYGHNGRSGPIRYSYAGVRRLGLA